MSTITLQVSNMVMVVTKLRLSVGVCVSCARGGCMRARACVYACVRACGCVRLCVVVCGCAVVSVCVLVAGLLCGGGGDK